MTLQNIVDKRQYFVFEMGLHVVIRGDDPHGSKKLYFSVEKVETYQVYSIDL